jgi:DNA-binding NarL/FixJ family response regulator
LNRLKRAQQRMKTSRPITILLADDHSVVRQGLSCLLSNSGGFSIVGQARTGREAVELAGTLQPDVILMDIAMPVLNGFEATRQILSMNAKARVIMLSAHSDDEYVDRMGVVGAAGFLEKQTSAEVLVSAIHAVCEGRTFISPLISRRRAQRGSRQQGRDGLRAVNAERLTSREAEVLQLVAEGSANKQVAATLGISIKTVEKHRQHLMDKLGIHDTAGLTRYAIGHGIIESGVRVTMV